jgi:endonuclease/exonuclease/phosphatase family metal-dependent hydrolase
MTDTPSPLKLVTFNVHGWYDSAFAFNVPRVITILDKLQPDLVGIQEVQGDAEFLARKLGSQWKAFFAPVVGNFGNAVVSKLNITSMCNYKFEVGEAEPRGMIGVSLEHPVLKLVLSTHLDHISEDIRLKQLEQLVAVIEPHKNTPHIILGDFNALSKDDYSSEYFDRYVYGVRLRNNWELPKFTVTEYLKKIGYVDCWQKLNPDAKDRSTCRFRTRIDYFFASSALVPFIDWTKSSCDIYLDTSNASDHEPVVLNLFFLNNDNNTDNDSKTNNERGD